MNVHFLTIVRKCPPNTQIENFSILKLLFYTHLQSLHYEEVNATGIGASVAEEALKVAERFLLEASSETRVLARATSQETTDVSEILSRSCDYLHVISESMRVVFIC